MKKAELQKIIDRYSFRLIIQDEITKEVVGFWLETEEAIPEIDALVKQTENIFGDFSTYFFRDKLAYGPYRYSIYPPKSWLDLWGLR